MSYVKWGSGRADRVGRTACFAVEYKGARGMALKEAVEDISAHIINDVQRDVYP
jgi:hypothetical protein